MDRRRPSPEEWEEIKKHDEENTRRNDERRPEEVSERAQWTLDRVGLEFKDLKGKTVLDLGSGPSNLERAARSKGIDSVISLERFLRRMSKRTELEGRVQGDAMSLPLKDESIDLIIGIAGPPTLGGMPEERVRQNLSEIRRVLKKEGEARISPCWFYFAVKKFLESKNFHKGYRESNYEERIKLEDIYAKAAGYSTEYIKDQGFLVELKKPQQHPPYWVLKKSVESNETAETREKSF